MVFPKTMFFLLMVDTSILMCHVKFRDHQSVAVFWPPHGRAGPEVAFVNDVGLSTLGTLSPSNRVVAARHPSGDYP